MPNLRNLEVEYVSLVDRAAVRDPSNPTEAQRFLLFKKESGAQTPTGGDMPPTIEELSAELQSTKAKLDKAERKLAKKTEKTEPVKLDKSTLAPEVREALEKAERERDELKKTAEQASEIAKSERDQRLEREFVAKAEREYPHVGGDSTLFGKLLKTAAQKLSKEEYEALETSLRAAEQQIADGALFKSLGASGTPTADATGTADLARKADELRKSDPNLSRYDAMRLAMGSPEQQARYLASVR